MGKGVHLCYLILCVVVVAHKHLEVGGYFHSFRQL